jgi:hypothetical protein
MQIRSVQEVHTVLLFLWVIQRIEPTRSAHTCALFIAFVHAAARNQYGDRPADRNQTDVARELRMGCPNADLDIRMSIPGVIGAISNPSRSSGLIIRIVAAGRSADHRLMIRLRPSTIAVPCVLAVPEDAQAQGAARQGTPTRVFTLDEALQYAVEHFPTVKAAVEQVNASTAGVSVARAGYLPRLDSLWQSNRATANHIFGQVLPQAGHSGDVRTGAVVCI